MLGTNGIVASHIDLAGYEIVLTRAYLGSIFLLVLCLDTRERAESFRYRKDTVMLLVSGMMLGIVNTGFCCYLYFSSMQKLPVRTVSICGYIKPIAAVVFSMLLLGESLSLAQLVGGALILGGAVYGEYSARKKQGA